MHRPAVKERVSTYTEDEDCLQKRLFMRIHFQDDKAWYALPEKVNMTATKLSVKIGRSHADSPKRRTISDDFDAENQVRKSPKSSNRSSPRGSPKGKLSPARATRHSPRGKGADRFGEHESPRKSTLGRSPGAIANAKTSPIGSAPASLKDAIAESPTRRRLSVLFRKAGGTEKELPSGLVLEGDENEAADAKDKLDIEPATPPKDSEGAAASQLDDALEDAISCRVAVQSWAGQKNGFRKANQDAYVLAKAEDRKCLLFGVFDGHGPNGHHASQFIKNNLPSSILKQPDLARDPEEAFRQSFLSVDGNLDTSVDCNVSGTTAVLAHIAGRKLTLAWVGDSRGVLCRSNADGICEGLPLTIDHKPDSIGERRRILSCNGRVDRLIDQYGEEVGPYRVWLRHAPILGLAMSRSMGDVLAHSVGVSSVPESISRNPLTIEIAHLQTSTHVITSADKFLILASDGIWEFISSEEGVKIVQDCATPEAGCKKLMMTARARWLALDHGCYVDDITCMVISFNHTRTSSASPSA
ncbi:Protein phosphatase 2C family protein [Klebsormidium nitens]|uniref:protein-serine/threonine phosphatase n=1 Tax=Klebsormidium nitens TaxID=105231 RepID=A0A1Y1HTR2_KLENI|nr:Protein phosphatase 2C family protein [Klebsormidium nitens]|eukprot:GAQ79916.1 Protein phosphatase 2C family protein [Klebsormidium nitens]